MGFLSCSTYFDIIGYIVEYFVIGENEIVMGFALIGVKGEVALSRNQVLDAFYRKTGKRIVEKEEIPTVLILTEFASSKIEEELREYQMHSAYPLIVEIPSIQGHLTGKKSLTDSIVEAVGIKV